MYDGIVKIAGSMTEDAILRPLEVSASALNQLGAVARRSLEMISVLEAMEAAAEEAKQRDKHQGSTPEELAMLAEFTEIEKGMDLETFKTSSDPFENERLVD